MCLLICIYHFFSLCLFSSGCRRAIKSEMFALLMHTNAQHLTGADSMKGEAAEINTYVMRGKGAAKWIVNLCLSKAELDIQIYNEDAP